MLISIVCSQEASRNSNVARLFQIHTVCFPLCVYFDRIELNFKNCSLFAKLLISQGFTHKPKPPSPPKIAPTPPKKTQKASQGTTILVLKYRVRVLLLALPYTGTTSLDSGIGVGGNLQLKLMTATFGALPWLICFHLSVCVCLCVCVRSSDGKSRSTRAAF